MSNFTARFFATATLALVCLFVAFSASAGTAATLPARKALRLTTAAAAAPMAKRQAVYNQGVVGKPRRGDLSWDARHGSSEVMPLDSRPTEQPGE